MMAKGKSNAGGQGLYLVLGCGDVGFAIAKRLKCRCAKVVVIERDADKVEQLRWFLDYTAVLGDFGSPEVLERAGIEQAEAVIVATWDFRSTERALKAIGELKAQLGIRPLVLVRVSDEMEVGEAKRLGADEALPSFQILADYVIGRLQN